MRIHIPAHQKKTLSYPKLYLLRQKEVLVNLRKPEAKSERNTTHECWNREVMLQRVQDFWVGGVLEKSLHNELLCEVAPEERGSIVEYTLAMCLQHFDCSSRILESNTEIIDIFDECQSLLILGEPGSGKTTTLLRLACQLIDRAQADPTQPLPVVFNLASWAEKKLRLGEWLLQELNSLYQIPKPMAEMWIETNALALLLDGLDEMTSKHRDLCAQAINYFRQTHPVSMVVCSCSTDYEMLSTKLGIRSAIVLQPLNFAQIDAHLESLGEDFAVVRAMVTYDKVLQTFARTPLMLNLISLVYRDKATAESHGFDSEEDCRGYLFDEFVKRRLSYRTSPTNKPYSDEQVIAWLSRLAQKMVQQNQAVFLVEHIQPSWLSTYLHLGIFAFGFRLLVVSSVTLLIWLLLGPFFTLYFEHALGFYQIIFGGGVVVSIWMLFYYLSDNIKPIDSVTWRWKTAMNDFRLKFSLGFGLLLTSVCSMIYPAGFVLFLWVTWLGFFTLGGLSSTEVKLGTVSNYPLWQSTRNCTRIWLLFLIGYGGFFGLLFVILGVPITGVVAAIGTWLIIGLIGGLRYGGLAVIQHSIVRLLLYLEKQAPLNYTHFLNYCERLSFLQKVGSGYIFFHPLLLEHFAAIDTVGGR